MCTTCAENMRYGWYDEETGAPIPVPLTRRHPKNKGQTPADWLIGHEDFQGSLDLVDRLSVYAEDGSRAPIDAVGYYTVYRGASRKTYSSPMFTFKDNTGYSCLGCDRQQEPGETAQFWIENHPDSAKNATKGCPCGDISRPGVECDEHPLSPVRSRWIILGQAPESVTCCWCKGYLPDDNIDHQNYCNNECKNRFAEDYTKRTGRNYWEYYV